MQLRRIFSILALLILTGCATSTNDSVKYEVSDDSQVGENIDADPTEASPRTPVQEIYESQGPEANEYNQIKIEFARGNYPRVIGAGLQFLKRFPRSYKKGRVYNFIGLGYLLQEKSAEAITSFRKAYEASESDEQLRQYALFNLASAYNDNGQTSQAQLTIKSVDPTRLDFQTRLKLHYLRATLESKLSNPLTASKEILAASYLLKSGQHQKATTVFQGLLERSLGEVSDLGAVKAQYNQYSDSILADSLLYVLASRNRARGQNADSQEYFRKIVESYPNSPHYQDALAALRSMHDGTEVNSKAIGALLPMTGKFEQFGEQVLEAMSLGLRIFNSKEGDAKITIFVEDSGDTPEKAVAALEKLYRDNRVIAVIGPILSKGIEAVTDRASQLQVPIITLSQKEGMKSDFVFNLGLTPEMQTEQIANYATGVKGFKKFAILYPNDSFGREYSTLFKTVVEQKGGQVLFNEGYEPKETDFRTTIDKVTGLFDISGRQQELRDLEKVRAEKGITKRTRKTEAFYKLPPIVDYEAVFIPDEAKTVGLLIPTFTYRDVDSVSFLGISTWDNEQLVKDASNEMEKAFFVDSYFANNQDPANQAFVKQFSAIQGRTPNAIEAAGFSAAQLIEAALLKIDGKPSRFDIRDQLAHTVNFPTPLGRISFDKSKLNYNLKILTAKKGQIIEAPSDGQ